VANHTLAMHLANDRLCLAVAESTLRSLRVTTLAEVAPGSPQAAEIIADRAWDRIVASLPTAGAVFRMLDLPFRDRRRLSQAVGPALEDYVPFSLDEMTIAFDLASTREPGPVLGVMVTREAVEAHRTAVAAYGLEAQRFIWAPSALLGAYRAAVGEEAAFTAVDVSTDGTVIGCFDEQGLTGMRTLGPSADDDKLVRDIAWSVRSLDPQCERLVFGGSRTQSLHLDLSETLSGLRFESLPTRAPLEMPHHLETGWRDSAVAVGLVLAATGELPRPCIELSAGGVLSSPEGRGELRDAALSLAPWAAVAVATFLAAYGLDVARLQRTTDRLEQRAEAIYRTAMPSGSGGVGRKTKLELRLSELERQRADAAGSRTHAGPLAVLLEMSRNVPADIEVEFDSYVYDAPNIRLSGQGASFETVTRLQQLLEARSAFSQVEVNDVHAAVAGSGVEFEMTIRLGDSAAGA
jgi:hypothetical protein